MTRLQKLKKCVQHLGRRKIVSRVNQEKSELQKVLSTFDLTALGVGCTLGVGVYVLPGLVAKQVAGPAVVLSFIFAGITSIFAGLCFAEFGARVPRAGSAYIYSYVTVGEFMAFTIGWSLIMEYIIGTASVARGLSVYLDSLTGNKMEAFYRTIYEFNGSTFISPYFDLFAFAISLVVTVGLAYGVKESMAANNLLTLLNVSIVLFVIVLGSTQIDFSNWTLPAEKVPPTAGTGGFFPFGILGAIKGASTCFYGYVGFDVVASSGEETVNPQKAIPLSIILSLLITSLAYCGISAVLTLMWPYYLQDVDAPIPYVFEQVGWSWAAWVVAVGGIFGLLASLFSGMYPLPRIIYSMANDGLLFRFLGRVHSKYRTPVVGTIVAGFITGLMGATFELKHLVDLMSIATLLAYAIVAISVLILRYRPSEEYSYMCESEQLIGSANLVTCRNVLRQWFNTDRHIKPNRVSSRVALINTLIFSICCILIGNVLISYEAELAAGGVTPIVITVVLLTIMIMNVVSLSRQPSETEGLKFKVPLVPYLPAASIFLNLYLMILMDPDTWIRFAVWLAAGYLIYFFYGMRNSSERYRVEYEPIGIEDRAYDDED